MNAVRSAGIWFMMIGLIIVWTPLLAIIRWLDRDPIRYRTGRWFRRLGAAMVAVNPAWKVSVSGDIPDNPRLPYLFVGNHQSYADIPVVSVLPWDMKWLAKAELFKLPFLGWMLHWAMDIPVDRESRSSGAKALIQARDLLRKGSSLMIFPEGTRTADGEIGAFQSASVALAIKEGVPIVPIVIDGSFDALPRQSWHFGPPATIRVTLLPPVSTTGLTTKNAAELTEQIRRQMQDALAISKKQEG